MIIQQINKILQINYYFTEGKNSVFTLCFWGVNQVQLKSLRCLWCIFRDQAIPEHTVRVLSDFCSLSLLNYFRIKYLKMLQTVMEKKLSIVCALCVVRPLSKLSSIPGFCIIVGRKK